MRHYLAGGGGGGARVSVLEWRLPVRSQMKIRTEAQFTALNDCNFRLMNRVKYAAMVVRTYILILHILRRAGNKISRKFSYFVNTVKMS